MTFFAKTGENPVKQNQVCLQQIQYLRCNQHRLHANQICFFIKQAGVFLFLIPIRSAVSPKIIFYIFFQLITDVLVNTRIYDRKLPQNPLLDIKIKLLIFMVCRFCLCNWSLIKICSLLFYGAITLFTLFNWILYAFRSYSLNPEASCFLMKDRTT